VSAPQYRIEMKVVFNAGLYNLWKCKSAKLRKWQHITRKCEQQHRTVSLW